MKNCHELFLTDVKFNKTKLFNVIQSGRFLGALLDTLAVSLMKVVVPLAKNILIQLGTMEFASVVQRKVHEKESL